MTNAMVATAVPSPESNPGTVTVRWECAICRAVAEETVPDDEVHAGVVRSRATFRVHVQAMHPERVADVS